MDQGHRRGEDTLENPHEYYLYEVVARPDRTGYTPESFNE